MLNKSNFSSLLLLLLLFACQEEEPSVDCSSSTLSLELVATSSATCGGFDGTAEVVASGGQGVYQYRVDNGSFQSSSLLEGIYAGEHTITVLDESGCADQLNVFIEQEGIISYSTSIAPIITKNCALSGCHVSGSQRQDLTQKSRVLQLASEIKRRTQSGEMPKDGTLAQSDIDRIACWVDQGAMDN